MTPLPKDSDRPKIFHHSGDWGDVIYSLPVIAKAGGGVLFLTHDNRFPYPKPAREEITPEWVHNIAPLLEVQNYIWRVQFSTRLPFSTDYDLNKFREPWKSRSLKDFELLYKLHLQAFDMDWPAWLPWLRVDRIETVSGRDIVVNRTQRYHNDRFPWDKLVRKHAARMVFVGSEKEYGIFRGIGAPDVEIPWYPTKNLLDVARLIAGSKLFIGNQSSPLSIALGLGKNVVVETWPESANCAIDRKNALHWRGPGPLVIPPEWL